MPPNRKYDPGCVKRKRKEKDKALVRSQRGALDKFIIKQSVNIEEHVEEPMEAATVHDEEHLQVPMEGDEDVPVEENVENNEQENLENQEEENAFELGLNDNGDDIGDIGLDIYDPRNWDGLEPKWKDLLVKKGPQRDCLTGKGPRDKLKRCFISDFYTKYLPNGEKHHRNWLVYSMKLDKVFRFCCKLFKQKQQLSQLAYDGLRDWSHLANILKAHEGSVEHINHMSMWVELYARLENNQAIDKVVQDQIIRETEHWRKVLWRLFGFVQHLAKQGLAFRGSNEKIYEESNGNFMSLVEMTAVWDDPMKEHLRRKQNREIHYHYLSHKIQNEMILLLASEIKGGILKIIKEAKYFSVILDCTPDVSKVEQMTLILRCVDVSTIPVRVQEYFLQYVIVTDTTGQGLFEELQKVLHDLDLDIDNVRGQSYDNGSNMKGKHKGVQRKLLDINPRAFYTTCGSHSLNLTLSDIANCCAKAEDFFGVVQRIYKLFAESTKRWNVLKDNLPEKGFTLKSLSSTRWESRVNSVKAIVTQASEIREALLEVAENDTDASVKSDANGLARNQFGRYEFILGMVIWYDILVKVNIVSKELQSEDMRIDVAMDSVKALIAFFQKYREVGFEKAVDRAKEIAAELNIDTVFPKAIKRIPRRKKHFDEIATESYDPIYEDTTEESFRIQYFVYIVDHAISSLERRFEHYKQYEDTFGFLFSAEKLKSLDADELKTSCNKLEKKLQNGDISDIDGEDLFNELQLLQKHLPEEHTTASAILNFLKRMNCYPTCFLAYRILLTVPVTVASAERSFSKLKILKSYLRSTMTQERLNALALISIENEFLGKIDHESLIDDFASKNARKSMFNK